MRLTARMINIKVSRQKHSRLKVENDMKREKNMILVMITLLVTAALLAGCISGQKAPENPAPESTAPGSTAPGTTAPGNTTQGGNTSLGNADGEMAPYAVKTVLREMTSADPEKGIGVYGRYTELSAEGEVPEALSKALAEANARAKESVETRAAAFLAENSFPAAEKESDAQDPDTQDRFRYRNISYIVNVTRADKALFSILETEMDSGIGDAPGEYIRGNESCRFRASVYDTQSGKLLTLPDFLKDPDSIGERLENAVANKYECEGLYEGSGKETPAWTADYLGLRFYFDGGVIPEDKLQEQGYYYDKAVHVSIPYTALDGPLSEAAAKTPESFIAQIEKNTEYALPHDKRVIRVEKAEDSGGNEAYRIAIAEGGNEKPWWLEYAEAGSDYYVFRAQGKYYFYRLEDVQDRGYVYNFASPDGGFDRFENQNAQCFDSFLHELYLAVPYNPDCAHMRERSRKFMDPVSGLNTSYAPNGHYAFLPAQGRGRTWLHFALIDDALALDSRNVGCRLLHEISAKALDDAGNESGDTVIPAGEVLRFVSVDGESELYFYMSPEYNMYKSGARDYFYDCELTDGRKVRLTTRYETSFFVDGMYMDRIGEPVTLGAAQYEGGLGEVPEHTVKIAGKEYKLIRDLSLKTESGEEIDFGDDTWWIVENYIGTFSSEDGTAKLVISENGDASFEYEGREFKGKLPEKRYYRSNVEIFMEAGYERRTFRVIVEDKLPDHDPSFNNIRFYSEGEPATNEPSKVPPIEVELVRE